MDTLDRYPWVRHLFRHFILALFNLVQLSSMQKLELEMLRFVQVLESRLLQARIRFSLGQEAFGKRGLDWRWKRLLRLMLFMLLLLLLQKFVTYGQDLLVMICFLR